MTINKIHKGDEETASLSPAVVVEKDSLESADLTGKTMSAYPYVFTNEDGIIVYRAEFLVCDPCVKLEGQMCRTPECVFCFQDVRVARAVLNKTLNCPIIDGERIVLLPITQDGASPKERNSTTVPDHSPASDINNPNARHCAVCTEKLGTATFHLPPVCKPESESSISSKLAEIRERRGKLQYVATLTDIDTLLSIIDSLQAEKRVLWRERGGEVWVWQGDEDDHPESLACPILIQPDDLRAILNDASNMKAELVKRVREKADEYREQAERWQRQSLNEDNTMIKALDYSDRDVCLNKMAAMITLATELEAIEGDNQ